MDGPTILDSLEQMCRDIDAGCTLRRIDLGRALAPAIIGLSVAAGGCPGDLGCYPEYAAPPMPPVATEDCSDEIDNDRDGRTDCADDECAQDDACGAIMDYAAPFPGVVSDPPDDAHDAVQLYGRPFDTPGAGAGTSD